MLLNFLAFFSNSPKTRSRTTWILLTGQIACRAALGGHGVALCCDLGIAVVELLNIFSFAQNPAGSSGSFSDRAEFNQELALAILSVLFAMFSFLTKQS